MDLIDSIEFWLFYEREKHKSESSFINSCLQSLLAIKQEQHVPDWVPSTIELEMRLKGEESTEILVHFFTEAENEFFTVYEWTTVSDLITEIRSFWLFEKDANPHMYWLYRLSASQNEYDFPLFKEENIFLLLSVWEDEIKEMSTFEKEIPL